MKLIVFETEEWEHAACLRLLPEHEVSCTREPLNARTSSSYPDAEAITTFVNSKLSAEVLAHFPSLRLIATRSTGYDHIDLDYCREHGITVCNVPDYGDTTVAEHAFALLLALDRHIIPAVERTRRGDFSQTGLRGFDLRGKTLGVIGTGRIGRRVIEIAKGFGMDVLAFDMRPDDSAAQALGFRYGDLLDVLGRSDVVTLHVTATPQTHHLIGDRELAAMRDGVILINTARGSIIDVSALVRALADKKVGAAGLDVLPEEPLLRDEAEIFRGERQDTNAELRALLASHVLLRFPNVIVTPHIAYDTEDALRRILDTTIANIRAFAQGRPQNVV
ncbi:MAG: hydroxyacid dehydrogenase [Hyphomicrobiaceae bacterium]|nr:hydroxyacid dehydrogenase [Hyphomicrobiaceae bacterium]